MTEAPTTDETGSLEAMRASIDNVDAALVYILAERFRLTKKVGIYKAENDLPPADPAREERQVARLRQLAKDADLDPDFAEKFFSFVVKEVIRHHESLRQTQR
jgi:chorismate mutase